MLLASPPNTIDGRETSEFIEFITEDWRERVGGFSAVSAQSPLDVAMNGSLYEDVGGRLKFCNAGNDSVQVTCVGDDAS